MRILQVTDTHLHGRPDGMLRGVDTDSSVRAVMGEALARFPGCAAILATGDLVHEDPAGYGRFRDVFGSAGRPVLCIPGNHDDRDVMRRELSGPPFEICGAHRFGDWTVIMLDSLDAGRVGGRLSGAELARLERELAKSQDHHAMVCLHHHPVAMGSDWLDQIGLANARDFWRIVDDFPHVRAVSWGHVHQRLDGRRGDVRLFATPSTCAQFLPASDGFAIDTRPPGFRSYRLHPDGRIDSQTHWVDLLPQRRAASA